jgi:CrcB protein
MLKDILLVGAGGFVGSASRYALSAAMATASVKAGFPLGTFAVNTVGSLLIGMLIAVLPNNGWQQLCVAGFCGGFTTFSAFSLDAFRMMRGGEHSTAVIYIAASIVVCVLLVWLGVVTGNNFLKHK